MLYDKYSSSSTAGDIVSIAAFVGGEDGPWTTGGRTNIPVVSLVDDDFEAVHIKVRTGAASKYRLEILTCAQFEHTIGFPLISLVQKALPPVEAVLKKDDALNEVVKPGAPMGSVALDIASVPLPQRVRRSRKQNTRQQMATTQLPGGQQRTPKRSRRRRRRAQRARKSVTVNV